MKTSLGINVVLSTILILEASAIPFASIKTQGYPYSQQQWSSQQANTGLYNKPAQGWTSTTYQQAPTSYPAQVQYTPRPVSGYPVRSSQSTNSFSSSSASASANSRASNQLRLPSQPVSGLSGYDPKLNIVDLVLPNSKVTRTIPLPLPNENTKYKVYKINPSSFDTIPTDMKEPIIKAEAELDDAKIQLEKLIEIDSHNTYNNNNAAQSVAIASSDTSNVGYNNLQRLGNPGGLAQGSSNSYATATSSSFASSGNQSPVYTATPQNSLNQATSQTKQSNGYRNTQGDTTSSSNIYGNIGGLTYPSNNNYKVIYGSLPPSPIQQASSTSNSQTATSTASGTNGAFNSQYYLPANYNKRFTVGNKAGIYDPLYVSNTYNPINVNQGGTQVSSSSITKATTNVDQINSNQNSILTQGGSGYTNGAYASGVSLNNNNNKNNFGYQGGLPNQPGSSTTAFSSSTAVSQSGISYPSNVNYNPINGNQGAYKVSSSDFRAPLPSTLGENNLIASNIFNPTNQGGLVTQPEPSTDTIAKEFNSVISTDNRDGFSKTTNLNYSPINGNRYVTQPQNVASSSSSQSSSIITSGSENANVQSFGKYGSLSNYNTGNLYNVGYQRGGVGTPQGFSTSNDATASNSYSLYPSNNPTQLSYSVAQSLADSSFSNVASSSSPVYFTAENPTDKLDLPGHLPGPAIDDTTANRGPYQNSFILPSQSQFPTTTNDIPSNVESSGSNTGLNSGNDGIDNASLLPINYPAVNSVAISSATSQTLSGDSVLTHTINPNEKEINYEFPIQKETPNVPILNLDNNDSNNSPSSTSEIHSDTFSLAEKDTSVYTKDTGTFYDKFNYPYNKRKPVPHPVTPLDYAYPNIDGIDNTALPSIFPAEKTIVSSSATSEAFSSSSSGSTLTFDLNPIDKDDIYGYPIINETPYELPSGSNPNNRPSGTLTHADKDTPVYPSNIFDTSFDKLNYLNNKSNLVPNEVPLQDGSIDNTGSPPTNFPAKTSAVTSSATSQAFSSSGSTSSYNLNPIETYDAHGYPTQKETPFEPPSNTDFDGSNDGQNSNNGPSNTFNLANKDSKTNPSDILASFFDKLKHPKNKNKLAPNDVPSLNDSIDNTSSLPTNFPTKSSIVSTSSSATSQAFSSSDSTLSYNLNPIQKDDAYGYPTQKETLYEPPSNLDSNGSDDSSNSNNGPPTTSNADKETEVHHSDILASFFKKFKHPKHKSKLVPNRVPPQNYAYPNIDGIDSTGVPPTNVPAQKSIASSFATSQAFSSSSTSTDNFNQIRKDSAIRSHIKNEDAVNDHKNLSDDYYYFDDGDDNTTKNVASNPPIPTTSKTYNNGKNKGATPQPNDESSLTSTIVTSNEKHIQESERVIHNTFATSDVTTNVRDVTDIHKHRDSNNYYDSYYDDDIAEDALSSAVSSTSIDSTNDDFEESKPTGPLRVLLKIITNLEKLFTNKFNTKTCS